MVASTLPRRSAPNTSRSSTEGGTARTPSGSSEAAKDAELVRRFKAGDEEAFGEIVARYRGRMFAIALAQLHNRGDAEEIAQDTFIRAYRGLANFRGDSSLATWLQCIATNLARNRYWYFFCRHRHAMLSLDRAFGEDNQATFSDLIASDDPSPAREATAGEFTELVSECMGKLGARQREILTLRAGLNKSYSDIARALGISIGTVKSRIGRARKDLRALLALAYPEVAPDASSFDWFEPLRTSGGIASPQS